VSPININLLRSVLPRFRSFLQTEGEQWQKERQEKDKFFACYFSEEQIDSLDEGVLRELIHILWAFNSWTNKDWPLQEMLRSGLPVIRDAFKQLLYGADPLPNRFDGIKKTVRMMGAACISEILAHHDHTEYSIWNRRSRQGLIALGVDESDLPKSAQISGAQYPAYCKLAQDVRSQVAEVDPLFDDLMKLDLLLYYIALEEMGSDTAAEASVTMQSEGENFEHDVVVDQVIELGDGLGFEVQKEFSVMPGCRIDAIWRSRVANLGTISYAFEVHRKGSRDSTILNLQRIRRDPTIQKVVIVSSKDELDRFKREIPSLDEGFRNAVGYFEVRDLQRALCHVQGLKEILNALGLLLTFAQPGDTDVGKKPDILCLCNLRTSIISGAG
jgi:hypothetical protein